MLDLRALWIIASWSSIYTEVENTTIMEEETLGSMIRKAREQRMWSQGELAEELGTTPMSVTRWEHDRAFPRMFYRRQLMETLGIGWEVFAQADEQRQRGGSPPSEEQASEICADEETNETVSAESSGAEVYEQAEREEKREHGEEAQRVEELRQKKRYHGWRDPSPKSSWDFEGELKKRNITPVWYQGPTGGTGDTHVTVNGEPLRYVGFNSAWEGSTSYHFEWGYRGEGPRSLSVSILADYLGTDTESVAQAFQNSADFMITVVSRWRNEDTDEWHLSGEEIEEWLRFPEGRHRRSPEL